MYYLIINSLISCFTFKNCNYINFNCVNYFIVLFINRFLKIYFIYNNLYKYETKSCSYNI